MVLNPVWPSSLFVFDLDPNASEVGFHVWDDDSFSRDDFLGEVKFPLPLKTDVVDTWLNLKTKGKGNNRYAGQVHVLLCKGTEYPTLQRDADGGWSLYRYRDLLPVVKTGDLILFSGNSFVSTGIRLQYNSPYSHCGVVIIEENEENKKIEPFIYEADWGKDFTSGDKKVYGILRNRFEDRVHSYPGIGIWYTPLKQKEKLTKEEEERYVKYVKGLKAAGVPYDIPQALLMGTPFISKEDEKAFFCSELVAAALKHVNRIPQNVNASRVDPFLAAGFDCFENGRAPARILRYTISASASVAVAPVITADRAD
eukprot:TRINITY_DN5004_c0_g1_i2.p1 TRINITY_DN5004_c0_g1~~TRINITY_DN5004_c0_g1_i2.p1  ORF type:complete len:312 (-),score=81.43 TRINITY_DN5004_c0_g1_i2:161-1096(-)